MSDGNGHDQRAGQRAQRADAAALEVEMPRAELVALKKKRMPKPVHCLYLVNFH